MENINVVIRPLSEKLVVVINKYFLKLQNKLNKILDVSILILISNYMEIVYLKVR